MSYVLRWNKVVPLLSSIHQVSQVEENGKPNIVNYYNDTKGSIDNLNYLLKIRSTARKTNRWIVRYFFAVLDLAAINAYIIHKKNGGTLQHLDFIKRMVETYAESLIRLRLSDTQITISLGNQIRNYLEIKTKFSPITLHLLKNWTSKSQRSFALLMFRFCKKYSRTYVGMCITYQNWLFSQIVCITFLLYRWNTTKKLWTKLALAQNWEGCTTMKFIKTKPSRILHINYFLEKIGTEALTCGERIYTVHRIINKNPN